ncbi:sulfurtransferase complex subunit TusD [Moraxella oblonga]|uniref:sulfurtransferase complex subunit TusD n=1 Tax=Moraxella oblonga TaxID=200413 RepID=UPI0008305572|nr:sulfurtransferase complex subunit TusD [Moraxella oblonga]
MTTLLLITKSPHDKRHIQALDFAKHALAQGDDLRVFFYGDGAYIANRLMWQTADVPNLADEWVALANTQGLRLPVCVGTALARGVVDSENANRHGLDGENLRSPFYLVGLSELALMLGDDTKLMQF